MANHNHEGKIWDNIPSVVHRRYGPGTSFEVIDSLQPGQPLIVLCYSLGDTESFTTPGGQTNTSNAWDFVVIGDGDAGGYVADVFVETGDDIVKQLGEQGSCNLLQQRLASNPAPNEPPPFG